MDCKLLQGHLDAYVDRELEPTPMIEFEQHLDQCSECRNELRFARLLKQGVCEVSPVVAPAGLHGRIERALDREDAAEAGAHGRWGVVLAVAAVVALGLGAALKPAGNPVANAVVAEAGAAESSLALLRDVVAQHTDRLPADVTPERPEEVAPWFRGRLQFRVRSVDFEEPQVRLVGARLSHVRNARAARFYYDVGDSRMTMVVFKATPALKQALRDESSGQPFRRERVGSRVLTYRDVQGYTVPVIEHDGIVYAFTGDLDRQQLLRLAASARLP